MMKVPQCSGTYKHDNIHYLIHTSNEALSCNKQGVAFFTFWLLKPEFYHILPKKL